MATASMITVITIPKAMNRALLEARGDIVLFLDDDIIPDVELARGHEEAHRIEGVAAVVGQILQPGQETKTDRSKHRGHGLWRDLNFPFNSTARAFVSTVMAGNLSVKRTKALAAGGFDENFAKVAHRFEAEFARRLERSSGRILFEPAASVHHLRAPSGGTRVYGTYLRSAGGEFAVGDYYFALLEGSPLECLGYIGWRLLRSVTTRYHALHPWWIPARMIGELRGLSQAIRLVLRGQRLLTRPESGESNRDEVTLARN